MLELVEGQMLELELNLVFRMELGLVFRMSVGAGKGARQAGRQTDMNAGKLYDSMLYELI